MEKKDTPIWKLQSEEWYQKYSSIIYDGQNALIERGTLLPASGSVSASGLLSGLLAFPASCSGPMADSAYYGSGSGWESIADPSNYGSGSGWGPIADPSGSSSGSGGILTYGISLI